MENKFNILEKELSFSDERINYVKLKLEYQRKIANAENELKKQLPSRKDGDGASLIGNSIMTAIASSKEEVGTFGKLKELAVTIGEVKNMAFDYGLFQHFIDVRDIYVKKYLAILSAEGNKITDLLKEEGIEVAENEVIYMILSVLSESNVKNYIKEASKKIGIGSVSSVAHGTVVEMERQAQIERQNMSNSDVDAIVYDVITEPLNKCFFAYAYSNIFSSFIHTDDNGEAKNVSSFVNAAKKVSGYVFSNGKVQDALIKGIGEDVFMFFHQKMKYFSENDIMAYDVISNNDIEKATECYRYLSSNSCDETVYREKILEALVADPFRINIYFEILDRYGDANGELQKLAEIMTIDVDEHIENYLLNIYENGNISTLESTMELKSVILKKQTNLSRSDSKALKRVTYRQYFLELSKKAADMNRNEIVGEWQKIVDGNNTFVEDKGELISDEDCNIILERQFRIVESRKYYDIIRELDLTDDVTDGDKAYEFYEQGEDYIDFENKCLQVTGFSIERDGNLAEPNYSDEKFASDEILLGYFHYTREFDLISGGKSMIITNKRIYTTKEKFTDISSISSVTFGKKLLLYYVFLNKHDASKIQLPVSKEITEHAVQMISTLLIALNPSIINTSSVTTNLIPNNNTQFVQEKMSMVAETAKSTTSMAIDSAKKGLKTLWGKLGSK